MSDEEQTVKQAVSELLSGDEDEETLKHLDPWVLTIRRLLKEFQEERARARETFGWPEGEK